LWLISYMFHSVLFLESVDSVKTILCPLSALSLDEGLNSLCDKNASAALWKREPISMWGLHPVLNFEQ
jgi:hypothetical protein